MPRELARPDLKQATAPVAGLPAGHGRIRVSEDVWRAAGVTFSGG